MVSNFSKRFYIKAFILMLLIGIISVIISSLSYAGLKSTVEICILDVKILSPPETFFDKSGYYINTPVACEAKSKPLGYEQYIKWSGGGNPKSGTGGTFTTTYATDGFYRIDAITDSVLVAVTSYIPQIYLQHWGTDYLANGKIQDWHRKWYSQPPNYFLDSWSVYVPHPGQGPTFYLTIDWGDGEISGPILCTTEPDIAMPHTYKENGYYTVTTTVESTCELVDGFGKVVLLQPVVAQTEHTVGITNIP